MDKTLKLDTSRKAIKFDDWMDIKKDSFGGPKSAVDFKDGGGQAKGWQNEITRDKDHENGVFQHNTDGWWKAIAVSTRKKPEISDFGKWQSGDGKAKLSMEDFLEDNKAKES